jgi:hypothetical protein
MLLLLPPLFVSKLYLFLRLPVFRWSSLLTEEKGKEVGEEPTTRKLGPLQIIQYSLVLPLLINR